MASLAGSAGPMFWRSPTCLMSLRVSLRSSVPPETTTRRYSRSQHRPVPERSFLLSLGGFTCWSLSVAKAFLRSSSTRYSRRRAKPMCLRRRGPITCPCTASLSVQDSSEPAWRTRPVAGSISFNSLFTRPSNSALGGRAADGASLSLGLGLGERRFEHSEIPNARCATCCLEDAAVQVDDLPQGEVTHQARRRYSSSFFRSTRSEAAWKSSYGATRRSAIAARARSSGAIPRRSAAKRSRSAWAGERSMVSLMEGLYRGDAPANNPLQ